MKSLKTLAVMGALGVLILFYPSARAGQVHSSLPEKTISQSKKKKTLTFHNNGHTNNPEISHYRNFHKVLSAKTVKDEPSSEDNKRAEGLAPLKSHLDSLQHHSRLEHAKMKNSYINNVNNGNEANYRDLENQGYRRAQGLKKGSKETSPKPPLQNEPVLDLSEHPLIKYF